MSLLSEDEISHMNFTELIILIDKYSSLVTITSNRVLHHNTELLQMELAKRLMREGVSV